MVTVAIAHVIYAVLFDLIKVLQRWASIIVVISVINKAAYPEQKTWGGGWLAGWMTEI